MTKHQKQRALDQVSRFAATARDLGCDDDEDVFDAKLKSVASAPSEKATKQTTKRVGRK